MGGTTQEGTRKTVQKTTQEDVGTVRGRRERLREQTDRKIMKATLGIVISDGIGAVTIEEVARRSGVAKTTIYRRYRNADDLLQRIQPEVAGLPNFNDLKPSRSGLATMLQRIQDCFDSELGLKAVGVVAEYGKEVRKIEQRISEFTASHPAGRHERSRSLSAGAER